MLVSGVCFSGHSDAASGLSDGNEGRHEGRSMKRPQRRSVRSRSRHEKTSKVKLNVLEVSIESIRFYTVLVVSVNITLHYIQLGYKYRIIMSIN